MLAKGTERIGAFISRFLGDKQRADQPASPAIPNVHVKQVPINAGSVLVLRTIFMHEYLSEGVQGPQTDVGKATLQQRRMEVKMKLAEIVISRLASRVTLKKLNSPLELVLVCADPADISPNLLIDREHLRTKKELEEASKAFLVDAVIETAGRLWGMNIIEVDAVEKNTLRHLQALKARSWNPRRIAGRLCNYYELPLEEFYTEQPLSVSRPPQNPEPKFIRI